jgi:hypothetical protein
MVAMYWQLIATAGKLCRRYFSGDLLCSDPVFLSSKSEISSDTTISASFFEADERAELRLMDSSDIRSCGGRKDRGWSSFNLTDGPHAVRAGIDLDTGTTRSSASVFLGSSAV